MKEVAEIKELPFREIVERYYAPSKQGVLDVFDAASPERLGRYVFRGPNRISDEKLPVREVHIFDVDADDMMRLSCCKRYPAKHPTGDPQRVGEDEEILSSKEARFLAAQLGRYVCGQCVAALYGTIDKP